MSQHPGPTDSGVVEVNGAPLAYERTVAGPPVVLLHAGIADMRMWDAQLPALAARHTVIRYDMRGFGSSPMPDLPFAHHDDLAGLLATLGIARAALVGCSFGGRVAIDAAIAHPEMVERLALINPALGGFPWPEELDASEAQIEAAFEAGDFDRAAEVDLRTWVDGPERRPDQVDPAVRERAREMARHVYEVATDAGTPRALDPPAIERLDAVRVPALVISGALDQPMMREIAALLGERVAGARVASIPDAAHLASMEAPEAVNRLLLDFLDEGVSDGDG